MRPSLRQDLQGGTTLCLRLGHAAGFTVFRWRANVSHSGDTRGEGRGLTG